MKTAKKLLLFCLLGMIGLEALSYDFEVDGIYYKIISSSDKTCAVTFKKEWDDEVYSDYSGTIVIPSTIIYNEVTYAVTSITRSAFEGCVHLVSITIPNSVTSIGNSAFEDCSSLISVTIPTSITSIGVSVFSGCSSLVSVAIPNSVSSIGSYAFEACSSLVSITIPHSVSSIGNYAFAGCRSLVEIVSMLQIPFKFGDHAFTDIHSTCKLFVPTGTRDAYLAAGWTEQIFGGGVVVGEGEKDIITYSDGFLRYILYGLDYTASIIRIEEKGFSGDIVIPETIKFENETYTIIHIGNSAFYGCSSIASVTIPNSVTIIGNSAFHGCSSLASVTIPNSITSIGNSVFKGCSSLVSVTIPNSVTSIGNSAFSGCSSLISIIIPESVTAISSSAFNGCNQIESISWDSKINPSIVIQQCKNCSNIVLGNNVTSINEKTFYNTYLNSVVIGSNVLSIGANAFGFDSGKGSKPLKVIWLTNTPPSGYENVGGILNYVANEQYTNLTNKIVYPFLSSIFEVDGIRYVPVSPSERTCDAIDILYDKKVVHIGKTVLYRGVEMTIKQICPYSFYKKTSIEDVKLENEGGLGNYAFYGCKNIQTVNLYNHGNIGYQAFYGCTGIQTLNVSNNGYIGNQAFYGCTNIRNASISNNGTIGEEAFYGCTRLENLAVTNTGNINASAFRKSNISVKLDVGNSGEIKQYAFAEITGSFDAIVNKRLGYSVFANSTGLKNITLGENVTLIDEFAFYGCTQLQNIIIPDAVTSLGREAFSFCSRLQSATIGSGVPAINANTFIGCSSLREVQIGANVKTIGENAFKECSSLTDVRIGEKVEKIETEAFGLCKRLPVIRIPQSVMQISDKAFVGCTSLKQVIMDEKKGDISVDVLSLGSNDGSPLFVDCPLDSVYIGRNISYPTESENGYSPFYRNTSLRSVVITDRETEISPNEFYGCTNLKNVKIGDGVTTIGDWAFSGCSSLKSFAYGFSVKSIGKEAFSDCTAITSIRSRAIVPPVCGSQALDDLNKWECTLYVPVGYVNAYMAANQWKEFFFVQEGDLVTFPVTSISLNKESVTLKVNETETLVATLLPENATDKSVKWTSSNEAVATVDFNGVLTGKKPGKTVITAASASNPDISSICEVTVIQPVLGVSLNETSIILEEIGATYQLEATIIPEDASNKIVIWTSSDNLGNNVIFTQVKKATQLNTSAQFALYGNLGKLESSVGTPGGYYHDVSHIGADATGFTLFNLEEGRNGTYKIHYIYNDVYLKAPTAWAYMATTEDPAEAGEFVFAESSNLAGAFKIYLIGSFDKNGTQVKGYNMLQDWPDGMGSYPIASFDEDDADGESDWYLYMLDNQSSVCTVSESGLVTAVGSGKATVTAFTVDGGKTATCEVTVSIPVQSITLNAEMFQMSVGESKRLYAMLQPDNATDKSVKWTSSDETIAMVDTKGVVKAKRVGKAVITAASVSNPNVTTTCEVTIIQPVQSVSLNETSVVLNGIGATYQLTANVLPEDAENKSVTWASSDDKVCCVSEEGLVTAVGDGTATVTVTTVDGGKTAACEVTVVIPVTEIALSAETLELSVGEIKKLEATVSPENATDKSVTWTSSDEAIATVDGDGNVKVLKAGTAVIIVTSVSNPDVSVSCEVTVIQPVEVVALDVASIVLEEIGATYQLTAIVLPEDASEKGVTWASSDEAVCSVSEEGLVTAVGDGTATIIVTTVDGGKTAICEVTVVIPLTEISLSSETLVLSVGENKKLEATVSPENATDKSVTWKSSDEAIAKVDGEGYVKALKAGTVTITVTSFSYPDISASCEVTVIQPVESVTLDVASIVLEEIGATYWLTATVLPEDASDKSVIWASSDEKVCTVSAEGLVTAVGDGTANVTVTTVDGGKYATCQVRVNIPVKSITLYSDTLLMQVGDSRQLEAIIEPENATDKNLEWSTSDSSVAKVDSSGLVEAVAEGTALITVKSVAYPDVMAVCDVTVVEDNGIMMLQVGEMLYVRAIYDVTGRKLERLQQGINILLLNDGTIKKINLKN